MKSFFLWLMSLTIFGMGSASAQLGISEFYQSIARGWNTWDTYSQVSYTHMPEGFIINMVLKEYKDAFIMRNPLMYKSEQKMTLGAHADFGEYTDLEMEWQGMKFKFQSATDSGHLVLLITPLLVKSIKHPLLVAECGISWQYPGTISKINNQITWTSGKLTTTLFSSNPVTFIFHFFPSVLTS